MRSRCDGKCARPQPTDSLLCLGLGSMETPILKDLSQIAHLRVSRESFVTLPPVTPGSLSTGSWQEGEMRKAPGEREQSGKPLSQRGDSLPWCESFKGTPPGAAVPGIPLGSVDGTIVVLLCYLTSCSPQNAPSGRKRKGADRNLLIATEKHHYCFPSDQKSPCSFPSEEKGRSPFWAQWI